MSDIWRQINPDYSALNSATNGMGSAFQAATANSTPLSDLPAPKQTGLNKFLTGGISAVNSFAGGLPMALLKRLYPAGYAIEKSQEAAAPGATAIGNIAGTVGGLVKNPLGIAKLPGAIQGASALAKLANAGTRGTIGAAQYAVPSAVSQAIDTGDIGQAAKQGAINLGTGAALGTGAGLLGSVLQKPAQRFLENTNIRGAGVSPGAFKKAVIPFVKSQGGGPAAIRAAGDTERTALSNLISSKGLRSEGSQQKLLDEIHAQWDEIAKVGWGNTKISDIANEITLNPKVQDAVSRFADPAAGQKALEDLMTVANRQKDMGSLRRYLQDEVTHGLRAGDIEKAARGAIAQGIRETVDSTIMQKAPDLAAAKQLYAISRPIEQSLAMKAAGLGEPVASANSNTFAKAATAMIFGGTGAAIGGPLGAAAGQVVGDIGQRVIGKGINKVAGMAAGPLANLLQKGGGNVSRIASALPTEASNLAQSAQPQMPTLSDGQPAGTQNIQNAKPLPNQQNALMVKGTGTLPSIAAKEQGMPPQQVDTAKQKTISNYQTRIQAIIDNTYENQLKPYGIDHQEFMNYMMARIGDGKGGIDPKLAAPILFPQKEARDKFLKNYDTSLALQATNAGQAMQFGKGVGTGGIKQGIAQLASLTPATAPLGGGAMESKKAYEDLRSLIVNATGKKPAEVDNDLQTIKRQPGGNQQQLVEQYLQNNGIDLNQLKEFGLYGG